MLTCGFAWFVLDICSQVYSVSWNVFLPLSRHPVWYGDANWCDARSQGREEVRDQGWGQSRVGGLPAAERERAALAWCESLTDLAHAGASAEEYARVEAVFSPGEVAALTFAVVAINSWNRLAVGLGADVTSLDGIEASLTTQASQASVDGNRTA